MRALRILLLPLVLLGLALLAQPAAAQAGLPAPLGLGVSDFAGVLGQDEIAELDALLTELRADPGVEVAVAVVPDLAGHDGIAGLARALFNQWGIGHASRNDGVLILLAMAEAEVRVALGAGYAPVWDGRAQRVIEVFMLPLFAKEDYAGGLRAGIRGLEQYLIRPHAEGVSFEDSPAPPRLWSGAGWLDFLLFAGFILLGGGFIAWDRRHGLGDLLAARRPCPQCGRAGVVLEKLPPHAGRPGLVRRVCHSCAWHQDREIPPESGGHDDGDHGRRDDSGGSDGGGGFGGGQSSGGGATGRW